MEKILIYPAGTAKATAYAAGFLPFPLIDHPAPDITHLLLDVPSFRSDGTLRDGGDPERLLERLPENLTVIGGNLDLPLLESYRKIDLLKDDAYTASNAAITARCALRVAMPHLSCTLLGCPVLIIGWGRIGKCLGRLLQALGADVTVAARKQKDRAMLEALGYRTEDTGKLASLLPKVRIIFNTAPETVLSAELVRLCSAECVKIELASRPGMVGEGILDARGLPGKIAPESSGKLISRTIARLLKEEIL